MLGETDFTECHVAAKLFSVPETRDHTLEARGAEMRPASRSVLFGSRGIL